MQLKYSVIAIVVVLQFAQSVQAADTRLMVCRGGADGRNKIKINWNITGSNNYMIFTYDFQKYTGSIGGIRADGSHLQPGQCSWDDNVIASHWNGWFTHRVENPNFAHSVTLTPVAAGSLAGQQDVSVQFFPDRGDLWQDYFPVLLGNGGALRFWQGSILDPDYIFRIWIYRDGDSLTFSHLGPVQKLY